jgi:hypothetical protein
MDSEELYNTNLKTHYSDLQTHGWIDNPFTYTFNSHGFRCEEFSDKQSIMFLGCSITCGVGLPLESIWSTMVANQLKLHNANLSVSAGSLDTAFRMCHGWIDKINPKLIILMKPPSIRIELVTNNRVYNVNPSIKEFDDLYKIWTIDDNNSYFNSEKNLLAIELLCLKRNIPFHVVDSFDLINSSSSRARDLMHPGVESHKIMSDIILSNI